MKLAIMQPYFFPYIGYFDLINYADKFIVFDTVQYIQRGWINRNRVLHPNSGWQYITVPLNKKTFTDSYRTAIKDVEIADSKDWNKKIIRRLEHYRKYSPYFFETKELVQESILIDEKSISKMNIQAIGRVCDKLKIKFDYEFFSQLDIQLDPHLPPQHKIIKICKELGGVTEYVNLSGGRGLYEEKEFLINGINLIFRSIPDFEYNCEGYEFVPKLSIIDVLMWNDPASIIKYLDKQKETRHNDD